MRGLVTWKRMRGKKRRYRKGDKTSRKMRGEEKKEKEKEGKKKEERREKRRRGEAGEKKKRKRAVLMGGFFVVRADVHAYVPLTNESLLTVIHPPFFFAGTLFLAWS